MSVMFGRFLNFGNCVSLLSKDNIYQSLHLCATETQWTLSSMLKARRPTWRVKPTLKSLPDSTSLCLRLS